MGNQSQSGNSQNQGEGNKDADRKYREGATQHAQTGDPEREGREAEEALEGDEAEDLRSAEKTGKSRGEGPVSR
jgi:hypothetical protein